MPSRSSWLPPAGVSPVPVPGSGPRSVCTSQVEITAKVGIRVGASQNGQSEYSRPWWRLRRGLPILARATCRLLRRLGWGVEEAAGDGQGLVRARCTINSSLGVPILAARVQAAEAVVSRRVGSGAVLEQQLRALRVVVVTAHHECRPAVVLRTVDGGLPLD